MTQSVVGYFIYYWVEHISVTAARDGAVTFVTAQIHTFMYCRVAWYKLTIISVELLNRVVGEKTRFSETSVRTCQSTNFHIW